MTERVDSVLFPYPGDRVADGPIADPDFFADLNLDQIVAAITAQDDDLVFELSRKMVLRGVRGDIETIRYRQAVLQDCLDHPAIVRELYATAVESLHWSGERHFGSLAKYPSYVLNDSIDLMGKFLRSLEKLRGIADSHAHEFVSEGWTEFFAMIKRDLGAEYLADVASYLVRLKSYSNALLLSADLGTANKCGQYMLHEAPYHRWAWFKSQFD
jgi:hypothetical protein